MTTENDNPGTEPTTEPTTEPAGNTWTPPASQDELNRIISDRLKRQEAKFADYDKYKAAAAELEQIKASQMSELDRERAAREAAEARAAEREAAANQRLIRAAVIAEASKAGAVDADTVAALLPADAITVTDTGDVTGVAEAIAALIAAKPFLASKPAPAPAGGAPANPPKERNAGAITDEAALAGMSPQDIAKALSEGRLDALLG